MPSPTSPQHRFTPLPANLSTSVQQAPAHFHPGNPRFPSQPSVPGRRDKAAYQACHSEKEMPQREALCDMTQGPVLKRSRSCHIIYCAAGRGDGCLRRGERAETYGIHGARVMSSLSEVESYIVYCVEIGVQEDVGMRHVEWIRGSEIDGTSELLVPGRQELVSAGQ
ncbi:hypothetical protein NOR_01808 [Metarhizium rileyi]|uniref:Uncharacterized protein n=1 Tax=Metarhizium rileyi (strain RCEF 4871) TaxID=1649241 RepID=A0A162JSM3_METRR|nr:hypothetical protein NOR_01808 [Metarhizium rileyi RCEF 4871]